MKRFETPPDFKKRSGGSSLEYRSLQGNYTDNEITEQLEELKKHLNESSKTITDQQKFSKALQQIKEEYLMEIIFELLSESEGYDDTSPLRTQCLQEFVNRRLQRLLINTDSPDVYPNEIKMRILTSQNCR